MVSGNPETSRITGIYPDGQVYKEEEEEGKVFQVERKMAPRYEKLGCVSDKQ